MINKIYSDKRLSVLKDVYSYAASIVKIIQNSSHFYLYRGYKCHILEMAPGDS